MLITRWEDAQLTEAALRNVIQEVPCADPAERGCGQRAEERRDSCDAKQVPASAKPYTTRPGFAGAASPYILSWTCETASQIDSAVAMRRPISMNCTKQSCPDSERVSASAWNPNLTRCGKQIPGTMPSYRSWSDAFLSLSQVPRY